MSGKPSRNQKWAGSWRAQQGTPLMGTGDLTCPFSSSSWCLLFFWRCVGKWKHRLPWFASLIFSHRPKHAPDCHPCLLVPWSWFILLKGFRVAAWHTKHSSIINVRSYPQETQCPLVLQFSVQGKSVVASDFPFLYWLSILQSSKAKRMFECARVTNDWISLRINGSCSIMFLYSHKDVSLQRMCPPGAHESLNMKAKF